MEALLIIKLCSFSIANIFIKELVTLMILPDNISAIKYEFFEEVAYWVNRIHLFKHSILKNTCNQSPNLKSSVPKLN